MTTTVRRVALQIVSNSILTRWLVAVFVAAIATSPMMPGGGGPGGG